MPGGSLFQPTPSAKSIEDIMLDAQGLIAQPWDRSAPGAGQIMIDGTVYFMLVPLRAGQVITNISIVCTTTSAGLTISKVGLYKTDGTRLALSADQTTSWQTAGLKTVALTAAYTVPATGAYYTAIFAKTGTSMPTVYRTAVSSVAQTAVGTGLQPFGTQTGQTDLPSSATIGVGSGISYWTGLS